MKIQAESLGTDELISTLSSTQGPRGRRHPSLELAVALLVGLVLAVACTSAALGLRSDLAMSAARPAVWLKLAVTGSIVAMAGMAALRLSLPGRTWTGARIALGVTFTMVAAWAGIDLLTMPMRDWAPCIEGRDWSTCLIAIPLLSLGPMITVGIAMRRLAPTRLKTAGTLLGLASGAIAAMAFSLYCRDDALPFLALWYGIALAFSAMIGRLAGPSFLRW